MGTTEPHVIVLFGAGGDLARRKLLPGLLHLFESGLMPEFAVVGTSLEDLGDEGFRDIARRSSRSSAAPPASQQGLDDFVAAAHLCAHGDGAAGPRRGRRGAEERLGGAPRRLHYLSIPPSAARQVVQEIGEAGLVERARVIMEKPFGTDLATARQLNAVVHEVFAEDQVFRIDHFLGKEAAQNILALRFANGLFEPIWNRSHIDHIQIDVPETLGVGTRAAFYEGTGAYRDMVVTHLLQVLAFVAMEPPTALEPARDHARRRTRSSARCGRSTPRTWCAGSTRATARSTGRRAGLGHGDVRGAALRSRQLALVRGAVLPAHRQAHGGGRADHLDRLP